jgi:Mrp family chromosome partitioning ATPase
VDAPDRVLVDSVAEPGGEAPIDGARMLTALRASAVPLAAGVVLVTVLAFVISVATPDRYRATARIVQSPLGLSTTSGDTDQRDLATSLAFLTTPAVRAAAARRVPGETAASLEDKVTAGLQSGADVIEVSATDGDPARAAAIANAVADGFLEARAASARAAIARTSEALTAQLAAAPPAAQAAAIRTRLGDLAVQRANAGADLQLAEAATAPSGPYAPRPLRNAVVAFFAALFVGVVGVLVLERLRPRAGGARELGRLWGVRVLASLPAGGGGGRGGSGGDLAERLAALGRRLPPALERPVRRVLAILERRRSARNARASAATDEALHALLGAVLLDLPPGRRRVLLVTSPRRGQGSACVAAGLARALARAGQDTLALSVDLASPALAEQLGVPPGPGLAQALEHTVAGGGAALHVVAHDGVTVVPHDGEARDGIGLLRPGAIDALFAAIETSGYGFVVVEAPGLVSMPEPRLAAQHADAILLACPERAAAEDVADAREVLRALDVPVLGVVAVAGGEARGAAALDRPVVPSSNGAGPPEPETRELVARLRAADHPLTTAELRGAVGDLSTTRLRAQLRRLVERGEVERAGTGRPGDPYVYGVRDR